MSEIHSGLSLAGAAAAANNDVAAFFTPKIHCLLRGHLVKVLPTLRAAAMRSTSVMLLSDLMVLEDRRKATEVTVARLRAAMANLSNGAC